MKNDLGDTLTKMFEADIRWYRKLFDEEAREKEYFCDGCCLLLLEYKIQSVDGRMVCPECGKEMRLLLYGATDV